MKLIARKPVPYLELAILCHLLLTSSAFLIPKWKALAFRETRSRWLQGTETRLSSSRIEVSPEDSTEKKNLEQNSLYVHGLMENLTGLLDKYIMNGSPKTRERVFNVLDQISKIAIDGDLVKKSIRMVKRAGVPMDRTYLEKVTNELGKSDSVQRKKEAEERKKWETQRTSEVGPQIAQNLGGRSALSRRATNNGKPDVFLSSVMDPDSIRTIAKDKSELELEMNSGGDGNKRPDRQVASGVTSAAAANRVSELVAKAGAGASFDGESLGIGGLDEVLSQVKRRVWTPLAAPPQLLEELGIHPVRGLLLYGKPGCGKTLLARTLGKILSPMRPITVVSGPEIMDKFVGSSEKNLRDIFDNPPDIFDTYRLGEADGGDAVARAALHVVVMDEFDAVARTRGGRGGKGEQGDAGVARDSVVNQLLAKMDGVHPLPVPTLVIGLTNKRSLIEPALLRPGRFEVQVEVPPPRTIEQRMSILKVHTKSMNEAGRLLVSDPPPGTAAEKALERNRSVDLRSYEGLLEELAQQCEDYSGAALAGVARAAASHALERAVNEFSERLNSSIASDATSTGPGIMDCLVTRDDFYEAVADVMSSMGNSDYSDDSEEATTSGVDERDTNEGFLSDEDGEDPVSPA